MTKSKLEHSLKITIPAKSFAEKIDAKLAEIQKDAKIAGFRPGQTPMNLIRAKYENAVKGEVLDSLVQEQVEATFKKENIRPALRPKIELDKFEEGKDISVKIEVEALPEVKVKDYSGLVVRRMKATAGDKEVADALNKLAESKKTTEPSTEKRATKTGDVIVIDFVGTIDGKEFKGGNGKDYYLALGSNTFIPGFEDQLTGQKVGAEVDVNVTFPANYHAKELAGKKALFKTTIKELRQFKLPEINDEFAKGFGLENLAKLKEMIKGELDKEYTRVARTHAKRSLLDALAAEYDFEVPAGMVDLEYNSIMAQYEQAKKENRLDDEEKSKSEADIKKEYRAIAERRVRLGLLLAEVANQSKMTLSNEDLTNAVMAEARRYPGQEKMVFEYYQKNPQAVDALRAPLFEEKVVDFMLGKVKVNEEDVSVKDLYDFDPDAPKSKKKGK